MVDGAKLLEAIYAISDEKKIDREIVLEGIREGFQKAYEKYFDPEANIVVKIDEQTGGVTAFKELKVVNEIEDEWLDILLEDAKKISNKEISVGDTVLEPVKFDENYSRLAIMQVGQIIKQKIREGEKNKIYEEFSDKKNQLIVGMVRDITANSYLIESNDLTIPIWNKKIIPGEDIQEGQRISFYIEDVSKESKYSQIVASRVHPEFLTKLLELEVPEIAEGIVEVKAVARDPGRRAKVAVVSYDENIDPIGSTVGAGGSRIKNITKELNGEKIDVISWSDDQKQFIMNAFSPVKVISIDIDEEFNEVDVIVPNKQFSLAIGKFGSTAKLVANLLKMKVNISSLDEAKDYGLEVFWNGNITESQLEDPEFLNSVNKQIEKSKTFTKKDDFQRQNEIELENLYNDWEQEASIDEIQNNIKQFESISDEDEGQENTQVDLDNNEDFDEYYEK